MQNLAGAHQPACDQYSADSLGDQCSHGDSGNSHVKKEYKSHVQQDVDDTADDQDVQRSF